MEGRAADVVKRRSLVSEQDAVRAGRRRFLRGERIDVQAIAAELGVGRATLFRWFGDRDRLSSEVMWSLFSDTFEAELDRTPGSGSRRLVQALVGALETINAHDEFRRWVARDPQRALVVLTGPGSALSQGIRARLAELIVRDCPGAVSAELPADELAYALVRVAESYLYADVLAARPVDVARTRPLFHRLLEGS